MRKLLATLFVVATLMGGLVAVAGPASSALCIRINITLFGTTIGTGPTPICLG